MGEEEQYYVKNHHEPIISEEIWDKAKEIAILMRGKALQSSNDYSGWI